MRLTAREYAGTVYDLEERRLVRKPRWVESPELVAVDVVNIDCQRATLEAYKLRIDGEVVRAYGVPVVYRAVGKFRVNLRRRTQQQASAASECVRCGSPLVLVGDDLCPICRAKEQGRVIRIEPVNSVLDARPCDAKCGRQATWSVIDETDVSPVAAPGRFGPNTLFSRAAMVGRRWYCSWCYRPPRILDSRGEVVRTDDEAGGVRP